MARPHRLTAPELTHHVFQRGNNHTAMFVEDRDYRVFRRCIATALEKHPCRVHAYVLMTNHFHLLVTPCAEGAIGRLMQSIGRTYVRYFNDRTGRSGSLWEGRYRDRPIDTEGYLLACYRYIELNPVDAHMVSEPRDYQWSSYAANALGWRDALITPHPVYTSLGADETRRMRAYRELFDIEISAETLAEILPSLTPSLTPTLTPV